MRNRRWVPTVLTVVVLAVLTTGAALAAPAAPAKPGIQQGIWKGQSDQGFKLSFSVLQSSRGLVLEPSELDSTLTCSATGEQFGFGILFFGFKVKIDDAGNFAFKFFDPFFGDFEFAGTLGDTTGSGTELLALAGLTKDLGTQLCSSGTVGWHAHAPVAGGRQVASSIKTSYTLTLQKDSSGKVSATIAQG